MGRNPGVLEGDVLDKPPFLNAGRYGLKGGRKVPNGQLRELLSVDDMVGRLTTLLRPSGGVEHARDLHVRQRIHLGDHGIGGDGGTAGQKRLPYTASVKVPLLVRWPGHVPNGVLDNGFVGTVDIAPTILDAAGIAPDPANPPLDGRSLLDRRDRILLEYWHELSIPTWASVRTTTYQYTEWYDDDGGALIFSEYYNLVHDPWQLENILADQDPTNDPDTSFHWRPSSPRTAAAWGRGRPPACP